MQEYTSIHGVDLDQHPAEKLEQMEKSRFLRLVARKSSPRSTSTTRLPQVSNGYNRVDRRAANCAPVAQPGSCDDSLKQCLGNPNQSAGATSSNLVRASNPTRAA